MKAISKNSSRIKQTMEAGWEDGVKCINTDSVIFRDTRKSQKNISLLLVVINESWIIIHSTMRTKATIFLSTTWQAVYFTESNSWIHYITLSAVKAFNIHMFQQVHIIPMSPRIDDWENIIWRNILLKR